MNRKRFLIILAALCVLAASPLLADLDGTWAGTGSGWCQSPPWSPSDFVVYGWQHWKGHIDNETSFQGEWSDKYNHSGPIVGYIVDINEEEEYAYCEGEWGLSGGYMGTFSMYFYYKDGFCTGEWGTYYEGGSGTMQGDWIEN